VSMLQKNSNRGLTFVPEPGFVAVYGGSFNPPHMGHQMACLYLLEGLGAKEIWLVPAFEHPLGKSLAPFEHRVKMCEELADGLGERVRVDISEKRTGGRGRSYDLMHHLSARHPQTRLAMVIGADILEETQRWHRWSDILDEFMVVVVGRGGHPTPHAGNILELPEVSSRSIRQSIRQGVTPTGMLPHDVLGYIQKEGLYR
jgi:nicotinate-nucleotide adenylyltransferase